MAAIAIIGCGLIGEMHAECLASLGNPAVLFVDHNPERAAKLAGKYGGRAESDPYAAASDPAIECVYICTYHDTHTLIALHAANSGKHLFIEKPMALTTEECRAIALAVKNNNVRCMTGFKLHYYTLARTARELLPKPILLTAQVIDRRWPDDSWANDPILGGGNVRAQGCHAVEMLCTLANSKPVRIFAQGGNLHHPRIDTIDTMSATITFSNGSIASLTVADAGETPTPGKFTFSAMDGSRSIYLHNRLQSLTFFDGSKAHSFVNEEDGFYNENREFLNAIQQDRIPETNQLHGAMATEVLEAGIESIRTNCPQELKFE